MVLRKPDMHVIWSCWIYKTKLKADGSEDKLKARLVARGNTQEEGVDYLETCNYVVRTATVRNCSSSRNNNELGNKADGCSTRIPSRWSL